MESVTNGEALKTKVSSDDVTVEKDLSTDDKENTTAKIVVDERTMYLKPDNQINKTDSTPLCNKQQVAHKRKIDDEDANHPTNDVEEIAKKAPSDSFLKPPAPSFIPAQLVASFPQSMKKELHCLKMTSTKFSMGRSLETSVCLRDVNISRLQVVFQFSGGKWSLTDHSSNGVSVNKAKVAKGVSVSIGHGDTIVLSDLPKLYSWILNLRGEGGEEPQAKRMRGESGVFGGKDELVMRMVNQRKDHERRMFHQRTMMENALKVGEKRLASVMEEKELMVVRMEEQTKRQQEKDQEAREKLAEEVAKQGREEREKALQEFELRLGAEREKEEARKAELMNEMESKIKEEESKRRREMEDRDKLLTSLNEEKENLEKKFETDKADLECELKKLQDRLSEQDLSTEAKEAQWKEKLTELSSEMESRLSREKELLEDLVGKEKAEKERLEREVEQQKQRRELELETERAMHAAQLEMLQEEREKIEAELRLKDEEVEKRKKDQEEQDEKVRQEMERRKRDQEELRVRLEQMEKRREEMAKEIEAERVGKAATVEESSAREARIAALDQELSALREQQEGGQGEEREQGRKEMLDQLEETLENQYQCPTCLELFISPVSLNCGHTYCWLCLAQWKACSSRTRGDQGTCPQCRLAVQHENRVFAIEQMIEAMVKKFGVEKQKEREEKVKERKEDEQKFRDSNPPASAVRTAEPVGQRRNSVVVPVLRGGRITATRGGGAARVARRVQPPGPPIELSSSEESDDSNEDSNSNSDDHSDDSSGSHSESQNPGDSSQDSAVDSDTLDSHVPGIPGALYGGFGRCHRCNRRGHWAPGCPF